MKVRHVISAFLERDDRVLLLLRSPSATTYPGLWAAISGYIEQSPLQQAFREIHEETGFKEEDLELCATGEPRVVEDANADREWVIHPFLFVVLTTSDPVLNFEHTAWKWVDDQTLASLDTVPELETTLHRLRVRRKPS